MKTTAAFAFVLLTLCCVSTASAVTIDMVLVGNPGNAADTKVMISDGTTGYGSVGYVYQMGKYEVTAGQYAEFLNAVAKADPNGLYNTSMGDPVGALGANIRRTGSSPNFSYSVASDWANRPVNWVSFWDAARFANWLHNGQPTGPQGPGTTENGAYHNVGDQTLFGRNTGALFFIPTDDEWYKAAYHDRNAGIAASYFDYPTGTNNAIGYDVSETTNPGNNANYIYNHYVIGSPYYRTVAGEFALSDSPYGTFDQGGNVWEWNETNVLSSSRALRGGSFLNVGSDFLSAHFRGVPDPTYEIYSVGFRMASFVPEPGSVTLCVVGAVIMVLRRRKRSLDVG